MRRGSRKVVEGSLMHGQHQPTPIVLSPCRAASLPCYTPHGISVPRINHLVDTKLGEDSQAGMWQFAQFAQNIDVKARASSLPFARMLADVGIVDFAMN